METHSVFAGSQRPARNALLAFAILIPLQEVSFVKAQSCGSTGLAVQVLGSGGPEMQDKRASSSYLIWDHGAARVIVDAGGGSALRFGESGAQMSQVDVVLFSHFISTTVAIFRPWYSLPGLKTGSAPCRCTVLRGTISCRPLVGLCMIFSVSRTGPGAT